MFTWLLFSPSSQARELPEAKVAGNQAFRRLQSPGSKDEILSTMQKGSDLVLLVKKEDYDSFNTKNPLQKMEDVYSSFVLNRSGPFYFIRGKSERCQKGQKLIVLVMAVRDKPYHRPSHTPAPSPAANTPKAASPAPSLSAISGSVLRLGGSVVGILAFGVSIGMSLIFGSIGGFV